MNSPMHKTLKIVSLFLAVAILSSCAMETVCGTSKRGAKAKHKKYFRY